MIRIYLFEVVVGQCRPRVLACHRGSNSGNNSRVDGRDPCLCFTSLKGGKLDDDVAARSGFRMVESIALGR